MALVHKQVFGSPTTGADIVLGEEREGERGKYSRHGLPSTGEVNCTIYHYLNCSVIDLMMTFDGCDD